MFSGIVDHCGEIISIETGQHAAGEVFTLWIRSQFNDLSLGESIAVDGTCLTVTEYRQDCFACELSPETMRLCIAQDYQIGTSVNLERALRLEDRLGGHFVSGHVDHLFTVLDIEPQEAFQKVTIGQLQAKWLPYLVTKGSVAINGVSLTINTVTAEHFSVMLIPHTLARTNLNHLKIGAHVNIEFDQLAKIVATQIQLQLPTSEKI